MKGSVHTCLIIKEEEAETTMLLLCYMSHLLVLEGLGRRIAKEVANAAHEGITEVTGRHPSFPW